MQQQMTVFMYTKIKLLGTLLVFTAFFIGCKKEEPVTINHNEQDSSVFINDLIVGNSWNSVNALFLPASRIQSMIPFSDKLLLSFIDNSHVSALYGTNGFQLSQQEPSDFSGSGGGFESLEIINGTPYGLGQFGNYGVFKFDISINFAPWSEFSYTESSVYSMTSFNGQLIAACAISPFLRVVDSGASVPFTADMDGPVNKLFQYKGDMIAAGNFSSSNGTALNNIARWNGTAWVPLGEGLSGVVRDLCVFNNELIAVGNFTESGDGNTNCRYVARWDGSSWKPLGTGLKGGINGAYVVHVYENQLFIGGQFIGSGNVDSRNIIKWTVQYGFTSLAGGINDIVGDIAVYNGHLYAVNQFHIINGNFLLRLD